MPPKTKLNLKNKYLDSLYHQVIGDVLQFNYKNMKNLKEYAI